MLINHKTAEYLQLSIDESHLLLSNLHNGKKMTKSQTNDLLEDWNHHFRSNNARRRSRLDPQGKSVSFRRTVRCIAIPALNDISQEEIEATWLTKEEMKASKEAMKRNVKTLRRAQKSGYTLKDSDTDSYRGLEHLVSSQELKKRQEHYLSIIDAVIDAQEDGKDENEIASASSSLSKEAKESAILMAKEDRNSTSFYDSLSSSSSDLLSTSISSDMLLATRRSPSGRALTTAAKDDSATSVTVLTTRRQELQEQKNTRQLISS